ncbi:MAG: ABC transporter ATP-binding protein [Promethearchaeota archaeon]
MVESNEIVISTKGLTKVYDDVTALNSLDLEVPKNSIFGFLGPNGAGKTTTIKLLLGLIKPTRGSGTVFGKDIVKESMEIRSRVGYLSQDGRYYEYMTARQILNFTFKFYYSGLKSQIKKRIDEVLEIVDLKEKSKRPIKVLSAGERQRLGIGQAMINRPELLILDEPAASLDPLGREDILKLMESLREHTTIFYSTHILDDVQRVSDRVAILNHGKLVAQGLLSELNKSGEIVYQIVLKGNTEKARTQLNDQHWISNIETSKQNGETEWLVSVTDEDVAEEKLLRLLLTSNNLRVLEFRRKEYRLEEIFMNIVRGR